MDAALSPIRVRRPSPTRQLTDAEQAVEVIKRLAALERRVLTVEEALRAQDIIKATGRHREP